VRRAASLAIDRNAINDAITLGYSKITGSIIPYTFEFFWQPPAPVYDPTKARQLLAEAGYAGGFDAGEYNIDSSYSNFGEAVLDNLQAIGIRATLRPLERAAFFEGYSNKKFKGLVQAASAAFGNAATRLTAFAVKGGPYAYGDYPEIDALYAQQATELSHEKRAEILDKMQQLIHQRTIYAPLLQLAFINGVGPRVGESGFGLIPGFAYTAPFEDITLKSS
jgi:peptide/nickel transport system substrate-binding protein